MRKVNDVGSVLGRRGRGGVALLCCFFFACLNPRPEEFPSGTIDEAPTAADGNTRAAPAGSEVGDPSAASAPESPESDESVGILLLPEPEPPPESVAPPAFAPPPLDAGVPGDAGVVDAGVD